MPNTRSDTGIIEIMDENLRQGFAQVPRPVLRAKGLSVKAKIVYIALLDYAWQQGSCYPGQVRLAEDLSISVDTVQRALAELKKYQLVDWKQRGLNQTNVYRLLPLGENPHLFPADPENRNLRLPETAGLRFQETADSGTNNKQKEKDSDISNFRTAQAKKSRDKTRETETASNLHIPDQTTSEPINGGEATASVPRADVEAAAAPNGSQGHVVPLRSETALRSDSMAPGDHAPTRSRQDGGFQPLAELLPLPSTPPRGRPPGSRNERDIVTVYLRDLRLFLGDEAPLWSSVSRAINIFKQARIPIERWPDLLLEANSITKSSTQHIQKKPGESSHGFAAKNRAPYYFAVLEDLCGLREQDDSPVSSTP